MRGLLLWMLLQCPSDLLCNGLLSVGTSCQHIASTPKHGEDLELGLGPTHLPSQHPIANVSLLGLLNFLFKLLYLCGR